MQGRPWHTVAVAAAAAALSLSCIAPRLSPCTLGQRRGPTAQPTAFVSEEAARRFEEKTRQFKEDTFRVELTEQEVTSYVALNLRDDLPISSPEIRFYTDEIVVEGEVTSPIRGHIVLSGGVTVVGGKPRIEFREARIGPLTVSGTVLQSMSDSLSDMMQTDDRDVEIEQIELLPGRIIISGRRLKP